VLLMGVRGVAVGEHLDLVELVHSDDAAGVLAVRARLAAETGRPGDIAPRQITDDLVHVIAGERHLGRPDQVEVLLWQLVDLGRVRAEEPGALHGLRLDQHRRDHRREAGLDRLLHREVEHGELQLRADSGQVEEPGARHLRAAFHVDGAEALAQLQMVLGLEVEGPRGADGLQDDEVVLASGRYAVLDQVRDGLEKVL